MNDDFASLFAYNRWANDKVLAACRHLTQAQFEAEPVPGWPSVRSTVAHIALVTEGWLAGLAGKADDHPMTADDLVTVDDIQRLLERAYAIVDELLPVLSPLRLATPQLLQRGGRSATLPPWAVMRHVVNHSTYHRGQVASKLKRFGVAQPDTDFIFWVFEQQGRSA
jgi:uncharacterized damage-inducible protein DinB